MSAGTLEDAVLRLFIWHRVPPLPREYETARLAHLRALRDLEARANLEVGQDGFLSADAFSKEVAKVKARFERVGDKILHDPHSYRYWTPTAEDWKKFAIRQAIAHAESRPLQRPEKKRRVGNPGSNRWRIAIILSNAYAEVMNDTSIPEAQKRKKAAEKASAYIGRLRKDGESIRAISARSIITGWKKFMLEDPEHWHQLPDYITDQMERGDHERDVANAANRLGLTKQLVPVLSEFLTWAYERVAPRDSGMDIFPPLSGTEVTTWGEYEQALASMPLKYREEYERLFADYEALCS